MNVLSLFDGMSCGRVALERCGIHVDNYFASEIDKYAIQISKNNYPDIKHLGDILNLDAKTLPKIDLVLGGSPCQGFSYSGKQLAFNDPRSKLFFEYIRVLKECKPKYFLLENVRMKKEYQDIISEYLNIEPIAINSNLVSAQSRYRLYWTNISNVKQPHDKGILLENILDCGSTSVFQRPRGFNKEGLVDSKSPTITPHSWEPNVFVPIDKHNSKNGLKCVGGADKKRWNSDKNLQRNIRQGNRVYDPEGKSPCLNANSGNASGGSVLIKYLDKYWRKLTPIECERLQTLPDNYTEGVSNSQRYKMIGNGWTVDVISHILDNLNREDD